MFLGFYMGVSGAPDSQLSSSENVSSPGSMLALLLLPEGPVQRVPCHRGRQHSEYDGFSSKPPFQRWETWQMRWADFEIVKRDIIWSLKPRGPFWSQRFQTWNEVSVGLEEASFPAHGLILQGIKWPWASKNNPEKCPARKKTWIPSYSCKEIEFCCQPPSTEGNGAQEGKACWPTP